MSFNKYEKTIMELAIASYGRVLGQGGLDFYSDILKNGVKTENEIRDDFMSNTESIARYPASLDNSLAVVQVFNNVLGRTPAQSGIDFYANRLDNGLSISQLIGEVLNDARKASGSDKDRLDNVVSAAQYYLDKSDSNITTPILSKIDHTEDSLILVKELIDSQCKQSYEEIVDSFTSNIDFKFDNSMPESEQTYIRNFHNKITAVLSEITGVNPNQSFDMIYDPLGHRSWNHPMTILKADKLPTNDNYFKSWYTVEIAHMYFKQQANEVKSLPIYSNNLRYNESNSQAITSIVADEYGKELGFSDEERIFYSMHSNQKFFDAFESLLDNSNIFSIYQTDTNYDINSTSLAATTHGILSLYKADNDFYKNLLTENNSWNGYEEYKEAFSKSIHTLNNTEARELVDSLSYFKQIDEIDKRPDMNLEIALFSSTDFPQTTINQQFAYDSPDRFIVYGQSYNIDENPLGTEPWDIVPDSKFFDSVAKVRIYDENKNLVYEYDDIDIKTDFANGFSGSIYNLNQSQKDILKDNQLYTIYAETTVNGIVLSDSLDLIYHI